MKRAALAAAIVIGCEPAARSTPALAPTGATSALAADASALAADAGADAQAPVRLALTEKDDGRTLVAEPGSEIEITLESNPTTGHLWRVTTVSAALGAPVERFIPPPRTTMGAPGRQVFEWKVGALPTGDHAIDLGYARHGKPPVRTFHVVVRGP